MFSVAQVFACKISFLRCLRSARHCGVAAFLAGGGVYFEQVGKERNVAYWEGSDLTR